MRPQIALITEKPNDTVPSSWSQFQSVSDFQNDTTVDVVVLNLPENKISRALETLRRDERYRLTLIYTLIEQSSIQLLGDGLLPSRADAIEKEHAQLCKRLAVFNRGRSPERFEEHVMAWLWTRPHTGITARRDTSLAHVYSYPLLGVFAGDEPVNQVLWLRLMSEQGLLASGELVDRIRLCSKCNSARLNYVDVCPECRDLDIAKEPALHCFTCGHVAPQDEFLKDGLMLCPNCLTRLRHIGSDYDRPMENLSCRACNVSFIDSLVHARCLDCNHSQEPDELRVREIRNYSMTEKARLRCRQGFSQDVSSEYFGRLSLINLNDFTSFLDWQIQQATRYPKLPECSLLGLHFDGLERALSTPEGQASLDTLIERIKQTIRDTDRCSRSREDLLWFLLPHTDRKGVKVLEQRLSELTKLLATADGSVQLKMAAITLPEDLLTEENAQLLMARLTGEIG
ncbi:diguanylate cyclase [Pseudomonas sp. C27(2019)]|uniref:TackOD1 domain-containing metal-binding protein n=1 Tax=Pseudomonas sp. C27(2019) TaxID=2604941 RepID=UPI0015B61721|nr:diguanylate cyclase [Pseudomonas sp. C27(2019)]